MRVLVTGSSNGIGKSIARKFLDEGHIVVGFDIEKSTISHENYTHFLVDVSLPDLFPYFEEPFDIVINNASTNDPDDALVVNIKGYMNVTEKYVLGNPNLYSALYIASQSARNGNDLPMYAATKGANVTYMKWVARQVAPNATCNSLSPGAVITNLNRHILDDKALFNAVANENLLKTWSSSIEIAEWAYFLTVVNKTATGADFLVDAGEADNYNFIW